MKQTAALACLLLIFIAPLRAAEAPTAEEQQLLAAIKEVQAQQAAIAENHAKIEAKLATVAEAVRIARIYSSRAGN